MATRILVVEEERALAEAVAFRLGADGFQVEHCATGAEALATVQGKCFDLILLDIGLPDANGFDLFHDLRAVCAAPIVFLTARADEVDRVCGLELGADDYVTKPFSPRELVARVRTVLRRWRRKPVAVDDNGSAFRVDDERRSIRYHGQALTLTRFEYDILRLLLGRPGRIFTREELLQRVWTEPEERCDRAVDAHIKTLRAKLAAVWPGAAVIRTHRGLGYALAEEDLACAAG